jgi:hypothetical protein
MKPTLEEGELLEVAECPAADLRVGDVIIFAPPGARPLVVHRLIHASTAAIRTRGDNNDRIDPDMSNDAVVGRVIGAWRGGVRRPIVGGALGLARAAALRRILPLARTASRLLPYRRAALALAMAWLHLGGGRVRLRTVTFRTHSGVRERILAGRFVVAERASPSGHWSIRYPLRLLIDEAALTLLVDASPAA